MLGACLVYHSSHSQK
uniref:Uncharacterized protein n=1 Tax=Arundo donax TaxID=35708 RepID=A0A0A9AW04_ARUDO